MNMKYRELWGNLRSITQLWLDKAAPSHDRAPLGKTVWGGRAPLREQQEGSLMCGPLLSHGHLQRTQAPPLCGGGSGGSLLHLCKCHLGI